MSSSIPFVIFLALFSKIVVFISFSLKHPAADIMLYRSLAYFDISYTTEELVILKFITRKMWWAILFYFRCR
ncbi:hypothetical protein D9X91_17115 [Falsibacillus albus]|uniref:Uncharacterized protein n=1 Tax=Falsibacillus albus TaxID=2478915 RepID=A0A3L7JRJ2_9BACI|nr:hypothetical protein D9X91_17115 [Falsibacillus albus]